MPWFPTYIRNSSWLRRRPSIYKSFQRLQKNWNRQLCLLKEEKKDRKKLSLARKLSSNNHQEKVTLAQRMPQRYPNLTLASSRREKSTSTSRRTSLSTMIRVWVTTRWFFATRSLSTHPKILACSQPQKARTISRWALTIRVSNNDPGSRPKMATCAWHLAEAALKSTRDYQLEDTMQVRSTTFIWTRW